MPKPFLKEFRADVIAVARQGAQSIAQDAGNFEVSVLPPPVAEGCRPRGRRLRSNLTVDCPRAARPT